MMSKEENSLILSPELRDFMLQREQLECNNNGRVGKLSKAIPPGRKTSNFWVKTRNTRVPPGRKPGKLPTAGTSQNVIPKNPQSR
ncbi:hypothetical protein CDAR_369291 [Caerostris darwini]|uniref:Uncharacterized protein n=1 Tax=Caerostris darwini TaxID=1538125 RepID=A0AAV4RXJ4_9ARAC|nr:hypothetical protein CDAR_369291 [Caerostris darwini]